MSCWRGCFPAKVDGEPKYIIPEELVDTTTAASLADRMVEEAKQLWDQSKTWRLDIEGNPAAGKPRVESVPVSGPLSKRGVRMFKSTGEIPSSADRVILMLASAEGYAVLDPISDPADLCKPIESFDWPGRPQALLQVEHAFMKMPFQSKRVAFVVLNALCPTDRFFLSKSCLHASLKGASDHREGLGPIPEQVKLEGVDPYVRVPYTFALQVQPHPSEPARCIVVCAQWVELGIPSGCIHDTFDLTNYVGKGYFAPLYARLLAKMNETDAAGRKAPAKIGDPFE